MDWFNFLISSMDTLLVENNFFNISFLYALLIAPVGYVEGLLHEPQFVRGADEFY